jgi:membrane protease YdiL (CAAX protease family)
MELPWYVGVLYWFDGSVLAWLAYRSRSLWMPIGWYFANDLILTTFIGVKGSGHVVQVSSRLCKMTRQR